MGLHLFRLIFAIVVGALALTGCSDRLTYRYRLTVEILADGVVHSGSSVLEVTHSRLFNMGVGGYNEGAGIAKGEAVAVDLGARGMVFAILSYRNRATDPSYFAEYMFGPRNSDGSVRLNTLAELRTGNFLNLKGTRELPQPYWPEMVRFSNIADPSSVELVDPAKLAEHPETGIKVQRVTVGITNEPVNNTISSVLNWLTLPKNQLFSLLRGRYWDYRDVNFKTGFGLKVSDFKKGIFP